MHRTRFTSDPFKGMDLYGLMHSGLARPHWTRAPTWHGLLGHMHHTCYANAAGAACIAARLERAALRDARAHLPATFTTPTTGTLKSTLTAHNVKTRLLKAPALGANAFQSSAGVKQLCDAWAHLPVTCTTSKTGTLKSSQCLGQAPF